MARNRATVPPSIETHNALKEPNSESLDSIARVIIFNQTGCRTSTQRPEIVDKKTHHASSVFSLRHQIRGSHRGVDYLRRPHPCRPLPSKVFRTWRG